MCYINKSRESGGMRSGNRRSAKTLDWEYNYLGHPVSVGDRAIITFFQVVTDIPLLTDCTVQTVQSVQSSEKKNEKIMELWISKNYRSLQMQLETYSNKMNPIQSL